MNIAAPVARILLGLVFLAAGLSGFLIFSNPPPAPPGLAGDFQHVFFRSGWVLVVDAAELIAGVLLLANRYVPLALVMLAALLVNIFTFHITMARSTLPIPIVVLVLWSILAWRFRTSLMPLLVQKAEPVRAPRSSAAPDATKTLLA